VVRDRLLDHLSSEVLIADVRKAPLHGGGPGRRRPAIPKPGGGQPCGLSGIRAIESRLGEHDLPRRRMGCYW
jgi:hypothetical protein